MFTWHHQITICWLKRTEACLSIFPSPLWFAGLQLMCCSRVMALLFSGANADGAEGMRLIRENGGLTLVQAINSAEFSAMPEAALTNNAALWEFQPENLELLFSRI